MTVVLGCIADDFTGATDLAGLLARSGVKVSLRLGVPETDPSTTETAAFEVIALKCRTEPVEEAISQTKTALNWLKAAGAERFFWKYCSTFDSTAQGNIGPVSEALMKELHTNQTIYCPAFPENGRSIFMGNLFVGEQPLNESPMKDHPLTPMTDANLMRVLTPQVAGNVGLANRLVVDQGVEALKDRLKELEKDGVNHVIVDAVANGDLKVIAQACRHMPLMTGGSALAMPLPALYLEDGLLSADAPKPVKPDLDAGQIVLSGSCSAMTRAQVAKYLGKADSFKLDPMVLAEEGPKRAIDWLKSLPPESSKIIYATDEPQNVAKLQEKLGVAKAGQIVEDALAELATQALAMGIRRFVVAGGETSGAVAKALGVTQMTIGQEIAPGVPWTFCTSNGHDIALTLKSGNFGQENFFADALTLLEDL